MIVSLFDGTKTDDDIYGILKKKVENKEINVKGEDEITVENNLKNFISALRNLVEENFFNTEG